MAEAVHSLIDIEVRSKGIEAVRTSLDRLVSSEQELVKATERVVKVRERLDSRLERAARRIDPEYRALKQAEQLQKDLNLAQAAGLSGTTAYEKALAGLQRQQALSSKAMNDNAAAVGLNRMQMLQSIHVARAFVDQVVAGQDPLRALAIEGGNIGQIFASGPGGVAGTLQAFGAIATRALFSPLGAAAALAASIAAVSIEAGRAQRQLAELGAQSKLTGLSAETLQGAKVLGAGAGLDEKASLGAFGAASKQFEAYGKNSGAVKSALDQIDKGFLGVLDKARSAGEFIDILNAKIAALPTRQAEQLAAALYGDEAAKRLLDSIQRGEVSMRALHEASGATGQSLGQSAMAAEEMRNRIERAAAEADNKLLNAFKNIKSPTDDIKLGWYGIVGAMADAIEKSDRLQRAFSAMTNWGALSKEIGRGYDALDRMLGARPIVSLEDENKPRIAGPGEIPFPNFYEAKQGFLPKLINPSIGETRKLFEKPDKPHKTSAEKEAEQYAKISKELEGQLGLVQATGAEHDKLALKLKVEAEQAKLGKDASAEHKQHIADLVTRIDAATKAQERLNESSKGFNEAYGSVANSLAGGIKDVAFGKAKPRDALQKSLESIQGSVFDAVLTGSGPFGELFGTAGKDGAVGGIFGGIAGMFGFGSGGLDKMTINAREVQLSQTGSGSGGGVSGFLGNLIGTTLKSMAGGFGGALGTVAPYDVGGIVGSPGGRRMTVPASAFIGAPHFAGGGAVPVIAHAGELILNASQQRNVAAALAAAGGVQSGNSGTTAAPKTEVHIHGAPPGTKVTESVDSRGNRRIDAVIDERWAASAGSPQGRQALQSMFDMRGSVARR